MIWECVKKSFALSRIWFVHTRNGSWDPHGENVTKYHILCGVLNQIIASHFVLLFYSNFLFWRVRDNYNFKRISFESKSNNFSLFLNFP